ncbi:hypothetical protein V6N12_014845 [Hibiscus sabdariffa]|uniref:Uncharacterized protein n=1 Tax=Hibiscus sabdariffa TaxID=183260 RepID=A0ABR2DLT8_9ROSI
MAHTGDENVEVVETQRETRTTKAKRASSRDQMSTLEDKYGDWLRAPLKKKQAFSAISKARIYFHEEGTGPVTVPSGFGDAVPLCVAPITTTWSPVHAAHLPGHAEAAPATTEEIATDAGINGADVAGLHGLSEVFAVDVSGHVHVSENALLGDEADDGESEVPGEEAPPIQLPAKRSSDGSDPSRVKRAKSVVSTLALKDTRNAKVGMSSSKNSLALVDKQPRRGK